MNHGVVRLFPVVVIVAFFVNLRLVGAGAAFQPLARPDDDDDDEDIPDRPLASSVTVQHGASRTTLNLTLDIPVPTAQST